MAFVGETVPKEKTGSAMGLLGTMSAIGTALGPSLGGVLISRLGWPAIFFVNVPLGCLALLLARRYLPVDRRAASADLGGFDKLGTLLLVLTLAAYALAMTIGRGHFSWLNIALLLAAAVGLGLFVVAETKATSPLIRLTMFRDAVLSTGLVLNAMVSTVMMATLVVGPFYLSRGLGLNEAAIGAVMSVGPMISALSGVLAGRMVDRWSASFIVVVGLMLMVAGSLALALIPALFGIAGYIAAVAVLSPGYQLFQAANNTAVMVDVSASERGVVSGMLNLARNLGLITGAAAMGAVFSFATASIDITTARAEAVANGMRVTFAVAAVLMMVAIAVAVVSRVRAR
jgi:MFS family permease